MSLPVEFDIASELSPSTNAEGRNVIFRSPGKPFFRFCSDEKLLAAHTA